MTITSDDIKKAFEPITNITKSDPVPVDLEAVATGLITKTADFANSEDPLAELDAIEDVVSKLDHMLQHASEDSSGNVIVSGSNAAIETAKSMHGMMGKKPMKAEEETGKAEDAEAETSETGKAEDAETEETSEEVVKADGEMDLSDDIDWENDLSPSVPPVMKGERMTKGERIVPAQKGALGSVSKASSAREKALARRASGERTLS